MGREVRRSNSNCSGATLIFNLTELDGVVRLEFDYRVDRRGHFVRTFCAEEFAAHGLSGTFVQCSQSFNLQRGTLRGMHWQAEPYPEGKLVRCTRGAIFDVVIDMRQESPTLYKWIGVELTAGNGQALYIPPGFAHGFQTLVNKSEVSYQMTVAYDSSLSRGARWDDPAFGINWPLSVPILSERDLSYPAL